MRFLIALLICAVPARAEIRVVTDIAPVYALVATVMEGAGSPELIVPQGASVHHHAMRPSEARALAQADVMFWIGPGLAPWLEKPVSTLGADAVEVPLIEAEGVHLLPVREGALFGGGDHDHSHDHGHEDEEASDPHVWLDPDNGVLFLQVIADALAKAEPENADLFARNAKQGQERLRKIDAEIDEKLGQVRGVPFIVLHDGFHYFEDHFAIEAIGAISGSDAQTPGAARLAELRAAVPDSRLACAFGEPQSGDKLIQTVTEGLDVRTDTLDSLGAKIPLTPALYEVLLISMADSMVRCLKG